MRHLRLVEPYDGGPAPDYLMHGGRPVTWRPWKPALPGANVRLSCGVCGDVNVWSTSGIIAPQSGDVEAAVEQTRAADSFTYGFGRDLATFPLFRLFAFRCSACGDTSVFDTGESGAEWFEVDLTRGVAW